MINDTPITTSNLKQVLSEILDKKLDEKLQPVMEAINEVKPFKEKIDQMELALDEMESYSRRNNIIIHGIPKKVDENPIEVAIKACDAVGVKLDYQEIDAAHRLPQRKSSMDPPFIIRLVSRFKKEEIMCNARTKKPTAEVFGGDSKLRLFYNDHLTSRNQEIFLSAKVLWNDYLIWNKNGLVYGRSKEPGSARFRIYSTDEVTQLAATTKKTPQTQPTPNRPKRTIEDRSPNQGDSTGASKKWQSQLDRFRNKK